MFLFFADLVVLNTREKRTRCVNQGALRWPQRKLDVSAAAALLQTEAKSPVPKATILWHTMPRCLSLRART